MASAWILMTLALFAGGSASNIDRIVGGHPVPIEYRPSIVQVEFMWFEGVWAQDCGGTILTSTHVLSAAHCFPLSFPIQLHIRVRAGSSYRNTGGIVRHVSSWFNHPDFGQLQFNADITVLRLTNNLIYSPAVQQGMIPAQNAVIPDNVSVEYAGWGTTSFGGPSSPVLLETSVYTINNEFCRLRYVELSHGLIVTPNMICAGLLGVGGRDACQGDSGGPLYFKNITVGVIAWGHGCANETFPGVSTAVSSFTNWIISTVAST